MIAIQEKFTCMKIQIKHFLYTKAAHQRCHKGKENIFWKQFFSKNTSGVLLLYIASVCSPWDSLLYFFCHFTTSSRSRIKNTETQWHSDVTIPYSVTCNVFWSSQFWKQQTAVVFYIGGNGITSARIASFNVISIHKNFFFVNCYFIFRTPYSCKSCSYISYGISRAMWSLFGQRRHIAMDIAYKIYEQHFHEYSIRNIKVWL